MENFKQKKNKVVYLHKKKGTDEVVYVGIGKTSRPFDFVGRNPFWKKVHGKYGIDVEVIHTGLTWDEACKIEVELIEFYGRRDLDKGTLVNLTDGADGAYGYKHTDSSIEKMKERNKGEGNPMYGTSRTKEQNPFYGKTHSFKSKLKVSAAKSIQPVKMPSDKLIQLIRDLYVKGSYQTGIAALARRFKMSKKAVKLIVDAD